MVPSTKIELFCLGGDVYVLLLYRDTDGGGVAGI
jgi:hypothetical protein